MTDGPLVCAIDVGTSSVRAALVDRVGRTIAESRTTRRGSASQFEAQTLWTDVVVTLVHLTGKVGQRTPNALAIAGHVGTVVLDERDRPILAAGGWSDRRGVSELRVLWAESPHVWARSGRPSATGGALAVLAQLRAEEPEAFARVRTVFSPKDYINLLLTGARATDFTSAAYMLALNVSSRQWDKELTSAVGLPSWVFPELRHASNVIGSVSDEMAKLTGLPPGLPVAAGGPDGTVGAAAIVGTDSTSVVDIAGTTDVLVRVSARPADPVNGRAIVNPYLAEALWSRGGPTGMTGGSVAHWVEMFATGSSEAAHLMGAALSTVPPASNGLLALPHLTGSRFPTWREDEQSSIVGLGASCHPAQIIRAMHEGAAFAVREAIDVIDPSGSLPVLVAGGIAKSPQLVQLRADIFDRGVNTRTIPDASLLGAARLAQLSIGIHETLDDAIAAGRPSTSAVYPDPATRRLYDDAYDKWRTVRDAVLDLRRGS